MNDKIMGRLAKGRRTEGQVSPMDAVSRALFFAGTGNVLPSSQPKAVDPIDQQLKMQRLQTGDPDFIREQNALKLKTEFDNKVAQEKAMIEEKRKRQQEAGFGGQSAPSSGSSFGLAQSTEATPAIVNGQSPLGQMSSGKSSPASPYLQYAVPKIDPDTGVAIPDYQLKDNPDYITAAKQMELDEAEKANKEAEEQGRLSAQDMLDTISQIKAGKQYFGPGGDLPSQVAPSSFNPIKNPITPLGFDSEEYGKRANWQSNMNKIVASKVFETIQKMQAASKTGATGLGPISEPEFKALQSASTALNKTLNPQDAMRILDEMEAIQRKFLKLPTEQAQSTSTGMPDDQAYQEYLKMVGK